MDTLTLGTDGADVVLQARGIRGETYIPFKYTTPDKFWARLLCDTLHQEMGDMFREIRRGSYEAGWRDAKAKRAKADWFSGMFGRK